MCGIAGICGRFEAGQLQQRLQSMTGSLRHRGPDDQGAFVDIGGEAALGHTRLAILDLSSAGHQPMVSEDGRYVIVFNGEIFNFQRLRSELAAAGVQFRSRSDTEVVLAMYSRCGTRCVESLEGMFAFAIWDRLEQTIFLARDPLGIKPLYYWQAGSQLAFASEVRSLLKSDLAGRELSVGSMFRYLRLGSVPEPYTLVQGVWALPAGSWMMWKAGESQQQVYWRVEFRNKVQGHQEAVRLTRAALEESVDRHLVSDVPVGLFLSGGIDSTVLAALAVSRGHRHLRSFCLSFDESELNEGDLAARTSAYFGLQHVDCRMTPKKGIALTQHYLDAMDQPSNDGFNTYCVSWLAHDAGMKVVLSGLGSDEIFAGYPSFTRVPRLLHLHQQMHHLPFRHTAMRIMYSVTRQPRWLRLDEFLNAPAGVSEAWRAMRGIFTSDEAACLTRYLSGADPAGVGVDADSDGRRRDAAVSAGSLSDQISELELTGYMRNQLLRDSDVMSMAWGLELRVPFADRKLLDTLSAIDFRIRHLPHKQLLTDSVPEIPRWILRQPKRGFRFPFDEWANASWKSWFRVIDATSPVRCRTWYRKWSLLALQHFLQVNHILLPGRGQGRQAA